MRGDNDDDADDDGHDNDWHNAQLRSPQCTHTIARGHEASRDHYSSAAQAPIRLMRDYAACKQ